MKLYHDSIKEIGFVYKNWCLDCCEQFDCYYNYKKHREIVHDDHTDFPNSLIVRTRLKTKEAESQS